MVRRLLPPAFQCTPRGRPPSLPAFPATPQPHRTTISTHVFNLISPSPYLSHLLLSLPCSVPYITLLVVVVYDVILSVSGCYFSFCVVQKLFEMYMLHVAIVCVAVCRRDIEPSARTPPYHSAEPTSAPPVHVTFPTCVSVSPRRQPQISNCLAYEPTRRRPNVILDLPQRNPVLVLFCLCSAPPVRRAWATVCLRSQM